MILRRFEDIWHNLEQASQFWINDRGVEDHTVVGVFNGTQCVVFKGTPDACRAFIDNLTYLSD